MKVKWSNISIMPIFVGIEGDVASSFHLLHLFQEEEEEEEEDSTTTFENKKEVFSKRRVSIFHLLFY